MKLILENFRKFVNEEEVASIAGQDMPLEALYNDVLDKIILVLNAAYGKDNYKLYEILRDLAEFHAGGRRISEVHSKEQRNYMCAMADEDADRPRGLSKAEAKEMCTGPMKEEAEAAAMVEKQLKVLISAMKKRPSAYADPLEDFEKGRHEVEGMDSWLRMVDILAKKARQPEIRALVSRIHSNWFGRGQTLDQSKEEDHARAMKAMMNLEDNSDDEDNEKAVVLKDPPDIKRMKRGLKRISRPRSAGDFRSNKERFRKP